MTFQEAVTAFFNNKQATLWGRAFDIYDDAGKQRAAEWFVDQLTELQTIINGGAE